MTHIPVVAHAVADPPRQVVRQAEQMAEFLLQEHPELNVSDEFARFVPREIGAQPTLHIDDLSTIQRFDDRGADIGFYQDRARLRAGDGDYVVSCEPLTAGYETYCRDVLGLGSPHWVHPREPHVPLHIAEACWEDENVRAFLIDEVRRDRLRSIHPHMGTLPVWELAQLLFDATGRSVSVIAPPPALAQWVNDKVAFTSVVSKLFGETAVPKTMSAWNLSMVAQHVKDLASVTKMIGLKLPHSVGGAGNLVLEAEQFRGKSLSEVFHIVEREYAARKWDSGCQTLIDCWETDVLCSPSCQTWIPPESEGPPLIEGVFVQDVYGQEGMFVGNTLAQLSERVTQEIADRSWVLARMFQRLGYVGRCSFDLILLGSSIDESRLEFIECNGRWGGASLPMTLMNRLFGDWMRQPYATQDCFEEGLANVEFQDLALAWSEHLYDHRTGRGDTILMTPGKMRHQSGISVVALGATWDEAGHLARGIIPERLKSFIETRPAAAR